MWRNSVSRDLRYITCNLVVATIVSHVSELGVTVPLARENAFTSQGFKSAAQSPDTSKKVK